MKCLASGCTFRIQWIHEPEQDLVTVLRWIDRKKAPRFVELLLGAIRK